MRRRAGLWFPVVCALLGPVFVGVAQAASCTEALGPPAATVGLLKLEGLTPVTAEIAVTAGHSWLIEVREQGNDAILEILDMSGQVVLRTGHPEQRTGTQRAVVTPAGASIAVRVSGQEQSTGSASVRAFDMDNLKTAPQCLAALTSLATADAHFAAAKEISTGHATSATSARAGYQRARDAYLAAERALTDTADQELRGEAELAIAGVAYWGLQDWAQTAEWARTASKTLDTVDPYRRALADGLLAAALIEIGNAAIAGHRVPGFDQPAPQLLTRARSMLSALSHFHLQRGERYDAAVQLNNVALTYLYGGDYAGCAATELTASRLYGSIHETVRQAQVSQNRALCLWGLGRLPEAVALLDRVLPIVKADAIPNAYPTTLNNTALAHFALGHFDESLRLFDLSLTLAQQRQLRRDEGQALFGIGLNYYALGDRERALQFLERSRAKRVESGDARGRMQTVRALATVYADQGRLADALASDQEALGLAVAPSALEHIRIQVAVHTAAAGRPGEALAQLDALLGADTNGDTLIRAEALLQRGTVLREMGRPRDAFRDVVAAQPGLHRLGSIMEGFQADMELARDRRELGEPREALAAVDRALSRSDAVRAQSANPELRAQLQTPLRAAYDLKLDVLRSQYNLSVASGRTEEARRLAMTAFLTADSSRAQSLADLAAQRYPPAVRAALAREFRRREALYLELAGRRFAFEARLDSSGSADPRSRHLMQDIAELERQVDTLNSAIAARTLPQHGALSSRKAAGLPSVPDDAALVSYWLGSDYAYAWVLSGTGLEWIQLSAPALIADRSAALQRSLTRLVDIPLETRLDDARALYGLVIQPLEPWLSLAQQWVIIPDGALDYVPFAALRGAGEQADAFVVMHHDIAVTPAAWMLQARAAEAPAAGTHGILLVADPVYQRDDPRLVVPKQATIVTRGTESGAERREFSRLPYTAVEARDIAAQFASGEVRELTGLDATRERVLALDWSKYRYIHFATHGVVDAEVPQLSALILGSYDERGETADGAVRVADLALESINADVVVFSACDTALGRGTPSEGLLGLGTITLARGARTVLASLWPVADEMGARVITDFYRHLLHDEASAPEALGAAMRSAVAHDRFADPALWAAFQVSVATLGGGRPIRNARTAPLATSTRSQEQP